ncbi:MAG: peptidoglycan editing factor PgeF [Candidatus Falkowbacteria bacterium]
MLNFDFPDNLILGISEKSQGNMRVFRKKDHADTIHNREVFFSPLNKKVIAADLVHGNRVVRVDDATDDIIASCDALVTNNPELVLSITVADCLPVYFYDQENKVVGLAHAGWRGVESGIVKEVVKIFKNNYGSLASDISVFIGPHIGACHFEVGDEVVEKFSLWSEFILEREGKTFIDLAGIIKRQLLDVGLVDVSISSECTYCLRHKYFSYRRDNPVLDNLEVVTAYIGLK